MNKNTISEVAEALEPLYTVCDDSDRPDNIVSCYPKVDRVASFLQQGVELLLPGKFSPSKKDTARLSMFFDRSLKSLWQLMEPEFETAIPFRWLSSGRKEKTKPLSKEEIAKEASRIAEEFIRSLPGVRKLLIEDIRAAYNGDPAVLSYAEIKLASPGLMAIASHRLAHELYKLDLPLIPRIMAELTHTETGVDINPGAQIDEGFFIDHATGVVIGETAEIGKHVKLYQGVTIGAKSFSLDENGNPVKQIKRHPTIEDNVVVYANATILGGDTIIGSNSVVAGNVFLMKSVPPDSFVAVQSGELKIKPNRIG